MQWELIFSDMEGNELAKYPTASDVPPDGTEIFLENALIPGAGGLYVVKRVRRIYGEYTSHRARELALAGGPFEVVPKRAILYLESM